MTVAVESDALGPGGAVPVASRAQVVVLGVGRPHEVDYAAKQLAPEFPGKTPAQIRNAIVESARVPEFHNNREMVMNSARLKLRH